MTTIIDTYSLFGVVGEMFAYEHGTDAKAHEVRVSQALDPSGSFDMFPTDCGLIFFNHRLPFGSQGSNGVHRRISHQTIGDGALVCLVDNAIHQDEIIEIGHDDSLILGPFVAKYTLNYPFPIRLKMNSSLLICQHIRSRVAY